jgi:phage shock protein PspC (stress-responsive transcriptional regulator)/anti-sigma regulatory factor (Ser/Thr protein kinase)
MIDAMTAPAISLRFRARDDRRVLAGVAGGFADQHGVDPTLVRVALVVLTLAGGLGIVLYAAGAVLAGRSAPTTTPFPRDRRRDVAVVCVTAGLLSVVRSAGLWLGDPVMVPILVIATGIVVLALSRPDTGERPWTALPPEAFSSFGGKWLVIRIMAGAALIATGLFLVGTLDIGSVGVVSPSVRAGVIATALTVLGVGIVLGPWLARLVQGAADDRRDRIRADERAAMAAHLHDSVLQSLALIQRTADDPRRTVTLARRQERELREWLYGSGATDAVATTLVTALRDMAADVEDAYDVRVEVVAVGDRPLDGSGEALAAAAREACVNAAKHSGADEVSVFVEVGAEAIEVFVRDRGRGFDRSTVESDRRGISESIEGRVSRLGGTVEIDTAPGSGTEVTLTVPVVAEAAR